VLANHRLLVIDDLREAHDVFRDILTDVAPAQRELPQSALPGSATTCGVQTAFLVHSAYQGSEGLLLVERALAANQPYSVAFVDIRMPPGWDGVETTSKLWAADPDLQVVLCTAHADYQWVEIAKRLGPTDSLVILKKPFDNIEVLQLAHALSMKWLLAQQSKGRLEDLQRIAALRAQKLCAATQRLRCVWEHSIDGMRLTDREGRIIAVNDAYCKLVRMPRLKLLGQLFSVTEKDHGPTDRGPDYTGQFDAETIVPRLTAKVRLWNSEELALEISNSFIPSDGNGKSLLSIFRDTTERMGLEQQLRQAQKMEAVGQLAGGVAHDFNNILAAIRGNTELALMDADQISARTADNLNQVIAAADRAASLTSQLLAFGRKQTLQTRALNVNEVVANVTKMLARIIGEDIQLQSTFAAESPFVQADPAIVEQALINLVVNARDAMPRGGKLTIATHTTTLDAAYAQVHPEARPGQFVCLTVSDSGAGITPENLPHIFEPFFTTKGVGKSTGLGLATVHGIVEQHQGWVEVSSQLGVGSTFKVFLPAIEAPALTVPDPPVELKSPGGTETILLVEDEEPVRSLMSRLLQNFGYRVWVADSARAALELWRAQASEIDLLLTDIIMPGMNGRELAERLREQQPALKVIFMSGYGAGVLARNEAEPWQGTGPLLRKPFSSHELLQAVRQRLDESGG
jgi:PAS domain S-box-containing protein